MNKSRNTNNSADDEFGFDYGMSEEEFNKKHMKAIKKADSSYREKKPKSKTQKKDVWVKLADGLYEKQTKIAKKRKPKKKNPYKQERPIFRGLGSSSRGPGRV
jgi:hypothetical protein